MTIYKVIHEYEEDGGFGDAVFMEDCVGLFSTEEKANEFVRKYAKPHVYAVPYNKLTCGKLTVVKEKVDKEMDVKNMWWLEENAI